MYKQLTQSSMTYIPFSMRHRCLQIKAKYRAIFQEQSYADDAAAAAAAAAADDDDDDDDDEGDGEGEGEDEAPGSDFEGKPDEGTTTVAVSNGNIVAEDGQKYGRGDVDGQVLKDAPDGVKVYQMASAWYHVAYSETTNPFLKEARKAGRRRSQGTSVVGGVVGGRGGRDEVGGDLEEPHILYLSFPWICAYPQLCQIKEMNLSTGT